MTPGSSSRFASVGYDKAVLALRPRIRRVWNRVLPNAVLPLRISPGLWWLAERDAVSDMLFEGTFEKAERALLAKLLRPGMTVLDIGAHAGLYAMTAARLIGPAGRVIAFEPSARERARLERHLRLNRIANVTIEPIALGAADGEVELFVVDGSQTGCNSLRPPPGERVQAARVPIRRLDDYAERSELPRIDFVKIDVEGGERDVLRGGEQLFRCDRPMLLCEIEPARIAPWNYSPQEIFDLVTSWNYEWSPIAPGNYLARPRAL
jgi:FkbM family methyltransferase